MELPWRDRTSPLLAFAILLLLLSLMSLQWCLSLFEAQQPDDCGGWPGYGWEVELPGHSKPRRALDRMVQVLNGVRRPVIWSRQDAVQFAQGGCLSRSSWGPNAMLIPRNQCSVIEDDILQSIKNDTYGAWPSLRETAALENAARRSSCSAVGAGPFTGDAVERSRRIDQSRFVVRVNLHFPFSEGRRALKAQMPLESARVNKSLGLGTRTDILVLNPFALVQSDCLVNLSRNLEAHLSDTIILLHMHQRIGAERLLTCNERLYKSGSRLRIFPLNPAVKLLSQKLVAAAMNAKPHAMLDYRHVPFSSTGLTMIAAALKLCNSVHAFGFDGSPLSSYANTTYLTNGDHDILIERRVTRGIERCSVLREGRLCSKLKLLD
jgi:Glycosyltransferase family 29 (sialyltransferase)